MSRLSGGSPFKGTLSGLGNAGARVILDRPLDSGEVIRLTFPRKPGETRHRGRMIIGQVLHSRHELEHDRRSRLRLVYGLQEKTE